MLKRGIAISTVSLVGLLAGAPAAGATVFCVDTTGVDCDPGVYTGATGLQNALNAAETSAQADTVRVGAGTYMTPGPAGFVLDSGNDITVEGAGSGPGGTIIAIAPLGAEPGAQTFVQGLDIEPPGSAATTIKNVSVTIPTPAGTGANQNYNGIQTSDGSSISNVFVAGPVTTNAPIEGIIMDSGTISDSLIDVPRPGAFTQGVVASASTPNQDLVERTSIFADIGVTYSNAGTGAMRVRRTNVHARDIGVWASGGPSNLTVESTVIDLGAFGTGYGIQAEFANNNVATPTTLVADGVTIGNSPGFNTDVGVYARATDANVTGQDTVNVQFRNSVIDPSIDRAIRRQADNGNTVNVTTDHSNYDPTGIIDTNDAFMGGPTGFGSLTQLSATNLAPMFIDPTTSNFHLEDNSPLIDIGDPAPPLPGAQDVDGDARAVLALPGCNPRRDIGADEVVRLTPVTPFCPPPPAGGGTTTASTTPAPAAETPKKCKKGRKLKRGRCLKKKRKRQRE